jgi:hypothetical protein
VEFVTMIESVKKNVIRPPAAGIGFCDPAAPSSWTPFLWPRSEWARTPNHSVLYCAGMLALGMNEKSAPEHVTDRAKEELLQELRKRGFPAEKVFH